MYQVLSVILVVLATIIIKLFRRKTEAPAASPLLLSGNSHLNIHNFALSHKAHAIEVRGLNYVLLTHPDGVRDLMKYDTVVSYSNNIKYKEFYKDIIYPEGTLTASIANETLFFANGENWKHQRAVMNPAFNIEYLSKIVPTFVEKAELLLKLIGNGGENVDVKMWMQRYTLDALGSAAFGHEFGLLEGKENSASKAFLELIQAEIPAIEHIFPQITRVPISTYRKRYKLVNAVLAFTRETVGDREAAVARGKSAIDLLDAIVKSDMTTLQKQQNLWLLFLAGHETTASTLGWAFYYLAKHPEYQRAMYEEIVKVIGTKRNPAYEDLKNFNFIDMFIKEVLRVAAPFPILTGRVSSDVKTIDGLVVPPKTKVTPAIYAIHHHPDFWPEPEKFDPYRFSPENSKNINPYSYLPFSLGRRHCIGNNFSIFEQKVVLAMVVLKYHISYVCESGVKSGLFYSPSNVNVGLQLRS